MRISTLLVYLYKWQQCRKDTWGREKPYIKKKIVAFVHASCFVFKSFALRGREGGIEPSVMDLVFS